MRYFLAMMWMFLLMFPAYGDVLQGQIQENWTVENARSAAFHNIPYKKNMNWAPAIDPYYKENMIARANNQTRVGNRIITYFSSGNYAVYEDNSINTFYFKANGMLYAVEYDVGKSYPSKSYKYSYPSGELYTVSIEVYRNKSFIFDPDGTLLFNWDQNNCYDKNGNLHMTRYVVRY